MMFLIIYCKCSIVDYVVSTFTRKIAR